MLGEDVLDLIPPKGPFLLQPCDSLQEVQRQQRVAVHLVEPGEWGVGRKVGGGGKGRGLLVVSWQTQPLPHCSLHRDMLAPDGTREEARQRLLRPPLRVLPHVVLDICPTQLLEGGSER